MEKSWYEEISAQFIPKPPAVAQPAPSPNYPSLPMASAPGRTPQRSLPSAKKPQAPDRVPLTKEDVLLLMEMMHVLAIDIRHFRSAVGPQEFPNKAFHNATFHCFERASIKQKTLEKMQAYYRAAFEAHTSVTVELEAMMDRVMGLGTTLAPVAETELLTLHVEEDGATNG